MQNNKRLAIYDFDHTLCHSDGRVRLLNKKTKEVIKEITAAEYTEIQENGQWNENEEEFDFDDFRGKPKNGRPIEWTMKMLRRDIADPKCIVSLITGRDELSGPKQWLKDNGIDTTQIFLMCSGNPDKRPCYESVINSWEPDFIELYEDGMVYIHQCIEVCNKYSVGIDAYHITDEIIENQASGSISILCAR